MDKSKSYREVLGERLKSFRQSRNLSVYSVSQKGNIRIDQVNSVESGLKNYTIDAFLGYIAGSDLYMYFAEKTNNTGGTNFDELINKGVEEDPENQHK